MYEPDGVTTWFEDIQAFIIFRVVESRQYTLNINNMDARGSYAPIEKDETEVERLISGESRPSSSVSVRTVWKSD